MNFKSFQTARYIEAPQPSTNDVPLHRQLATIQNADQARLIRSLNLCRETDRYKTFNSDWPLDSAPSGREMAASGWFYLGNLDRTQCFSCGGVLRNWRRLDNPTTEHISHFPHCSMAQGRESRNIPDTKRQVLSPTSNVMSQLTGQQKADLRNMFPCEFPVTPSMRSVRERVNTFSNWHFTRTSPETIAEAGFFSLGVRDRVKCHYCNVGLQNWRQNDNPWEEHAKWFPTCEFLLQQRGPVYVHTIVAHFPNINRPILHAPGQDVPPAPQVRSGPEPPPPPERSADAQTSRSQAQNRLEIAMQSEVAEVVIGMGFDESLVRDVMRANIEEHGVGFQTATVLLDAVEAEQRVREAEERKNSDPPVKNSFLELFSLDEQVIEGEEEVEDIYDSGIDTDQGSQREQKTTRPFRRRKRKYAETTSFQSPSSATESKFTVHAVVVKQQRCHPASDETISCEIHVDEASESPKLNAEPPGVDQDRDEGSISRESFRAFSFQNRPSSSPINARQFAAAGFFYERLYDEVKCFACSNVLRDLSARIDPFLFSMHSATCWFVRGQDVENIPDTPRNIRRNQPHAIRDASREAPRSQAASSRRYGVADGTPATAGLSNPQIVPTPQEGSEERQTTRQAPARHICCFHEVRTNNILPVEVCLACTQRICPRHTEQHVCNA